MEKGGEGSIQGSFKWVIKLRILYSVLFFSPLEFAPHSQAPNKPESNKYRSNIEAVMLFMGNISKLTDSLDRIFESLVKLRQAQLI